jgi:hypothetical protein
MVEQKCKSDENKNEFFLTFSNSRKTSLYSNWKEKFSEA